MEHICLDDSAIAEYRFDASSGTALFDSSRDGSHGDIHGAVWHGSDTGRKSLYFDGHSYVRVDPFSARPLTNQISIEVWAKGTGAALQWKEMTPGDPPTRDPFFQVVGDRIYFATNTDISDPVRRRRCDWYILTGSMNTDGSDWSVRRRTYGPPFCIEPKLQVVGEEIHYHFFGGWTVELDAPLERRYDQIFTARSGIDGSDWEVIPRIHYIKGSKGSRTEQGAMQVVGQYIHHAFPRMDADGKWQLWTARSRLDGSDWQAIQRTKDGGWIPRLQVTSDAIYYIYSRYSKTHPQDRMFVARSDLDGNNWRVITTIQRDLSVPWVGFFVGQDLIYLSYAEHDESGVNCMYTASIDLDGGNLRAIKRGDGHSNTSSAKIQMIGDRLYYCYHRAVTDEEDPGATKPVQVWTAVSRLDGSGWQAQQITDGTIRYLSNYRSFQIVGGRTYYFANAARSLLFDQRVLFGTSGANLVNKGDAFGIGMTSEREVRGFINTGPDHLFRGQPESSSWPHCIDHSVDDTWHCFVMSFDGRELKLWIDGELAASRLAEASLVDNPFPLMIGEGFVGNIARIVVRNKALNASDIQRLTNHFPYG